jgi:predicted ribosomally synthesized peptide with nif11-like leader
MSQDHAKACIEKMKTDDAFRARVLAVEGLAARMQVINAEGFACSAEEIEAASAELNDADLSRVAGGLAGLQPSGLLGVKDHSV